MLVQSSATTTREIRIEYFRNTLNGYLNDYEVSGEIFYLEKAEAKIKKFIEKENEVNKGENNN
jgi:hypothetical protein